MLHGLINKLNAMASIYILVSCASLNCALQGLSCIGWEYGLVLTALVFYSSPYENKTGGADDCFSA